MIASRHTEYQSSTTNSCRRKTRAAFPNLFAPEQPLKIFSGLWEPLSPYNTRGSIRSTCLFFRRTPGYLEFDPVWQKTNGRGSVPLLQTRLDRRTISSGSLCSIFGGGGGKQNMHHPPLLARLPTSPALTHLGHRQLRNLPASPPPGWLHGGFPCVSSSLEASSSVANMVASPLGQSGLRTCFLIGWEENQEDNSSALRVD